MYSDELDLETGPWIPYDEFRLESLSPEQMLDLYRVTGGPGAGSFQLLLPPPPPAPPGHSGASASCRLLGGQPSPTCSVLKVKFNLFCPNRWCLLSPNIFLEVFRNEQNIFFTLA